MDKNMKTRLVCMLLSTLLAGSGVTVIDGSAIGGGVSQESEVIYEQESDFTVTIPKKIILGSDKSAEYAVMVRGSVGAGESVSVIPESEFTMNETGSRKSSVKGVATQDDTVWNYEQIEAGDAKNGNVTASGLTAGEWSGSLRFNINLEFQHEHVLGDNGKCTICGLEQYTKVYVEDESQSWDYVKPIFSYDTEVDAYRLDGFIDKNGIQYFFDNNGMDTVPYLSSLDEVTNSLLESVEYYPDRIGSHPIFRARLRNYVHDMEYIYVHDDYIYTLKQNF